MKCLVSVGTGEPAQSPINDNVIKFLSKKFVRLRHDDSRLDVHRLVHLATRKWLQSIGSLRQWQSYVLNWLNARFPDIDIMHGSQWRATVPHALWLPTLTRTRGSHPRDSLFVTQGSHLSNERCEDQ